MSTNCVRCGQREQAPGPGGLCGTCLWDLWGLANRDLDQVRGRVAELERQLAAETRRANDNAAIYDHLKTSLDQALAFTLAGEANRRRRDTELAANASGAEGRP